MGGARQRVQHVTDPQGIGVRQVEGAPVEAIEMGEMIHRGDDEVDRHDVDPPPFEADHREPRRHGVADLLNELEEVVGAVDLVDLAGLRVADDNSGPIDPPRNAGFGAHEALALVLRGIIGMLEPARLLEHVLAEYALVKPRGRNRADMMETARLDRVGEGERMGDARDVRGDDLRRVRSQVVDGGEVEKMVDLASEPARVLGRDPKIGLQDVAFYERHATGIGPPELLEARDQFGRRLVHENIDQLVVPLQQTPHETLPDKAGSTGDERAHKPSFSPNLSFSRYL